MFIQHFLLDNLLGSTYEIVFFKEHVMHHEPKCPDINFRSILLFTKELGRHKYGSTYNLVIELLLDCEPKIPKFENFMVTLLFCEDIIGLDIPMHNFFRRNELETSSQLINDRQSCFLGYSPSLDHILQIAIRAELKYHYHIVFRHEAIIYFRNEEDIFRI